MQYLVISACFSDPRRAQAACLLLRELGLPCRHQLGRRMVHVPVPCPAAPRHSRTKVTAIPAVGRSKTVINTVLPRGQAALARRVIRGLGGREIPPTPGPTAAPPHMIC